MGRPRRIICVGNRQVPGDDLGPNVHDLLAGGPLPDGIELIDGGLHGLDLLRAVEGAGRAVFVDALDGFGDPGTVLTLDRHQVAALADGPWGHHAGLPYLFHLLPQVCDGVVPEVLLVGAELPAGHEVVARVVASVAARALAEAARR